MWAVGITTRTQTCVASTLQTEPSRQHFFQKMSCVGGCVYMYKSFFTIFLFLSVIAVFSGAFQILNVANKKKTLSLNEINI